MYLPIWFLNCSRIVLRFLTKFGQYRLRKIWKIAWKITASPSTLGILQGDNQQQHQQNCEQQKFVSFAFSKPFQNAEFKTFLQLSSLVLMTLFVIMILSSSNSLLTGWMYFSHNFNYCLEWILWWIHFLELIL